MQLGTLIFTVAVLSWPIEMTPLEDIQKELTLLKMNIKNLEKSENDLKKKVEKLESNEDRMKMDIVNMKNKISILEMNEISTETKIVHQDNGKENMKAQQQNLTNLKNNEDQIDEGTEDAVMENVLDGKISHHENDDCCDDLSAEIDKIKLNIENFNTSMNHFIERLNDNTLKIIANQFEIKSNTNNIDTNANKIQNNQEDIDSNANGIDTNTNEIITNTNNVEDLMKRSDYCASKDTWSTDHKNQIINYDKLLVKNNHNIPGSNLDIHKGLFTVGVDGIYQIDVSLRLTTTHHKSSEVYIIRNLEIVRESRVTTSVDDNTNHNDAGGRYLLVALLAGDTVGVISGDLDQPIRDITFCINLLK